MHPLSRPAPSCKRGPPWNGPNTGYRADHRTGRVYRICRRCAALRTNLKYRTDEAYREREKQRCRENYRNRKPADTHAQ